MPKRIPKNYGYSNYYQQSSTARKLDVNSSEKNKKAKKPRNPMKKRMKPIYIDVGQTHLHVSGLMIFTIFLVFSYLLLVISSSTVISNKKREIRLLSEQLDEKRNENNIAKIEIEKNYDIKKIEEIASTKLKMGKPKPYQIVHINVATKDYLKDTDEVVKSENKNTIETIFSFAKKD